MKRKLSMTLAIILVATSFAGCDEETMTNELIEQYNNNEQIQDFVQEQVKEIIQEDLNINQELDLIVEDIKEEILEENNENTKEITEEINENKSVETLNIDSKVADIKETTPDRIPDGNQTLTTENSNAFDDTVNFNLTVKDENGNGIQGVTVTTRQNPNGNYILNADGSAQVPQDVSFTSSANGGIFYNLDYYENYRTDFTIDYHKSFVATVTSSTGITKEYDSRIVSTSQNLNFVSSFNTNDFNLSLAKGSENSFTITIKEVEDSNVSVATENVSAINSYVKINVTDTKGNPIQGVSTSFETIPVSHNYGETYGHLETEQTTNTQGQTSVNLIKQNIGENFFKSLNIMYNQPFNVTITDQLGNVASGEVDTISEALTGTNKYLVKFFSGDFDTIITENQTITLNVVITTK